MLRGLHRGVREPCRAADKALGTRAEEKGNLLVMGAQPVTCMGPAQQKAGQQIGGQAVQHEHPGSYIAPWPRQG